MSTTVNFQKNFTLGGDLTVRRMGYGAMRITGKGIWGPPENRQEAVRVLRRAVELGVNFIDTADSYGPSISEELIAEALHPYPAGLVIATKGGLLRSGPDQWHPDSSPKHLKEALKGSLDRLKLDRIDLYQLHRIDPKVPFEDSLEFLQGAQEEGLIRHIGLSEVDVPDIKKAETFVEVVSVQNKFSHDFRKWEPVLDYCRENGKAFIPWYPLSGGNVDSTNVIGEIASRLGATPYQVALAWMLHHSPNILLIPGTGNLRHLEENLKAEQLELTEDMLDKLEA